MAPITDFKAQGRTEAPGDAWAARFAGDLAPGYDFCPFQVKLKNFPGATSAAAGSRLAQTQGAEPTFQHK